MFLINDNLFIDRFKDAIDYDNAGNQQATVFESGEFVPNSQTLQQQMNILINLLISEGFPRRTGFKQIKSGARMNGRTSDEESAKLLTLLEKTQKKVNSLENEILNVEAENLHQDWGSTDCLK